MKNRIDKFTVFVFSMIVAFAAIGLAVSEAHAAVLPDGTLMQGDYDDLGNHYAIVGDSLVITDINGIEVVSHPAVAFHAIRPLGGCLAEQADGDVDVLWPQSTWPHSSWAQDYINSSEPGEWYQIPNHDLLDDDLGYAQYRVTETGWIITENNTGLRVTVPTAINADPPVFAVIQWNKGVHWTPPRFLCYSVRPPHATDPDGDIFGYIGVTTAVFVRQYTNGGHILTGTLEYETSNGPGEIPVLSGGTPPGVLCNETTRVLALNDMACALVDFGTYSVWIGGDTGLLDKNVVWIPSHGAMVDDFHYMPYGRNDFSKFFHRFYAPDGTRAEIIAISPPTDHGEDTRLIGVANGELFWTTPESKDVPGGTWFDGDPADIVRVSACKKWIECANPTRVEAAPWAEPRFRSPDINADGIVDTADLALVIFNLGSTGPDIPADLNNDQAVDTSDISIVISFFGLIT